MSSKKLGSGVAAAGRGGSGSVKAEDALQGQRVKAGSVAGAESVGKGAVLHSASEQPVVMEGEGTRVHDMFRSSRVKVEALDARRAELSQNSASAEDAAKSPGNNHDSSAPRHRSVTEIVRPAGDDADVKYEWQATRPRVCALPDETDAQVVELEWVIGGALGMSADTALRSLEPDRSDHSTRSSREDEPCKSIRGATAGKDDGRTWTAAREGHVHGAASPVYSPPQIPALEPGGERDGEEVGGGPSLGPRASAALETTRVPGAAGHVEQHSGGTSVVPPVNLTALQERGIQPTGKGQSFVETLHKLRVCKKSEIATYASLSDEKESVHLTGVNIFETSHWNERARNHSSGAASGQPSVPRKSVALPDLNEGGPTAAVVNPCLDEQQEEQLRAQILVYGALIHGNQIDESLMESAFGDGNSAEYRPESGKKCSREESWRTNCERRNNELTRSLMFPAQSAAERTAMPDVVLPSNNLAATGIHVEVVATPDEVPDSPLSPHSPVSPDMDPNAAPTVQATFDPVSPPMEIEVGNPEVSVTVTSEVLQAVDVAEGSFPVTPEPQISLIIGAPAASGQGHLLVPLENTTLVHSVPNLAPVQLADVGEMVGGITVDAFSSIGVKGSSRSIQPSHARRSPLNLPHSEMEGIGNGHSSGIADVMPVADLEGIGAGLVPEQVERAINHPEGVVRTAGPGDEIMEDVMTVDPTVASPEHSNAAQQAGDAIQDVVLTHGIKLTASNPAHPISELRQDALERDASHLDQARSRAEEAAADAAATLQHSTAIWTRVDAGDHSGLSVDQEDTLAFAAASLAAAASVAKGAAAAAKVAFEAASLASLMVKESTAKLHPSASSVGQGVLRAAREQTLKRAEDAAAASKRAQLLNAVARAAELATEAAEQTGAVISMGDPLRFTLQDLQEAGIDEHWKLGLTAKNAKTRAQTKAPVRRPAVRKRLSRPSRADAKVKEKSVSTSPATGIFKKESALLKKRKQKPALKGPKVAKKKSVAVRVRAARPLIATVPLSRARNRSSKTLAKPRLLKVARNGSASPKSPHPGPLLTSTSSQSPSRTVTADVGAKGTGSVPNGSITGGSVVEVLADEEGLRGAWFSGKVLRIQGVEALVVYDEILADDGTTPLQELVPLGSTEVGPPKIRLAHPINFPKSESAKKRRRTRLANRTWLIGQAVDAWIRDGWWEGKIESVSHEDETKVTVHFPGEGDTSVIKSWDLRPSLVWTNGDWVTPSEAQAQEDGPAAKRRKIASKSATAKPEKGKERQRGVSGGKGVVEMKSPKAIKKGNSERETKLKGNRGEQGGSKSAKKRKLVEISEDGEADNSARSLPTEQVAAGAEGQGQKEKSETKVEKQASKKKVAATKVLTDGEQTPQVSTVARTRRAGGQLALEIGLEPEKGAKSARQATGGQGKASSTSKTQKQAPVVQSKATTPAKRGKKATSRKTSTKGTPVKLTTLSMETPSSKDSPRKAAKDVTAARSAAQTNEASLAKGTPAKGTSRAKGASSVKSIPPVNVAADGPPARAVPATRSAPSVNDVPPEKDVPPSKGVVGTSKDGIPSRETNGTPDTSAKDGKRGSSSQPDVGSSAKRQKVQKRVVKTRRATGQTRRKSSRKVQATSQVVESQGNLNKQDSKQGWKSDLQSGTPRAKTVNQAVNILRAQQLQLLP